MIGKAQVACLGNIAAIIGILKIISAKDSIRAICYLFNTVCEDVIAIGDSAHHAIPISKFFFKQVAHRDIIVASGAPLRAKRGLQPSDTVTCTGIGGI